MTVDMIEPGNSRYSQAKVAAIPTDGCNASKAPGSNTTEATNKRVPPMRLVIAAICAGANDVINGRAITEPAE